MKPKTIKLAAFPVLLFLSAFLPSIVFAQEKINSFNGTVKINTDSSINVSEIISYDLGSTPRHGIFRDIPIKYQARGGNFNLRISNISVTNEASQPYKFQASVKGNNEEIKIGDPNALVNGSKDYVINYVINRAINYFKDHDELYWNVTGNGWEVPIDSITAKVALPKEVPAKDLQAKCFAGEFGSTDPCSSATVNQDGTVTFAQTNLAPGQGLTIVVGFPKGMVHAPSAAQNIQETIKDNWVLGVPVLTLFFLIYLWHTRGRDPQGYETVVAQYEAPIGLTPTEAGTVVDERADNQDVSAEIINLAVKGYIKITRIESKVLFFSSTDYQLDLLKQPTDLEKPFERTMVEALFGGKSTVKLSELKNNFYEDLKQIKGQVYDSVVTEGYFLKNPQTVRNIYLAAGIGIAALGVVLFVTTRQVFSLFAFGLSGIMVIIFSFFMPHKTKKGAEAKQYILGLKQYLAVAEKDRLAFHNAPEKSPARFEKLLPYAMVLGVEQAWAKQFEGIYTQPPSWYYDPSHRAFNAYIFASSLNSFSRSANTAFVSQPRSAGAAGGVSGFGGGGFSGGGFGGGGGGSW